jgi:hypothetical protein
MVHGYINVLETVGAGLPAQLKSGDTVAFRVHKRLAPDTWLVSLKGKQLQVRSEIPLMRGDVRKARVLFERGHLFLKLLPRQKPAAAAQILQEHGLPVNREYTTLIESLMRSGLPLKEELIQYAAKLLFSRNRGDIRRFGRFIAVLLDKGLRAAPEKVEELFHSVEGEPEGQDTASEERRRRGGQDRHGQPRRRSKQEEPEQEGSAHTDAPPVTPPEAGDIRSQCMRRGEPEHGLQLWNHLEGGRDNWIVIPLAWQHGDTRIEGRLRLHRQGNRTDRFTLSVFGTHRWHFSGCLVEGERSLRIYSSMGALPEGSARHLERLRENLHNEEIEIDDTINREEEFDPYESGYRQDLRGIDRFA